MSDQEGATQPARDERARAEQQSKQPERTGGGAQRDRDRGRRRHGQQNQPRRSETQLPMDELRDLFALFTEHGLTEFELEREGFRVHLGRNQSSQVISAHPVQAAPAPIPVHVSVPAAAQSAATTTAAASAAT